MNLVHSMPPKRRILRGRKSDEEIDVVGMDDDPCKQANDAMDEIAGTAAEQLRTLLGDARAKKRMESRTLKVDPTMPTSDNIIRTTNSDQAKRRKTAKAPATITSGTIVPSREPTNIGLSSNESFNTKLRHRPFVPSGILQEQPAAREFVNRGYALETMAASTSETTMELTYAGLQGETLMNYGSAPEPLSTSRVQKEQLTAQELLNRGYAEGALAALERFSRGLGQPPRSGNWGNEGKIIEIKTPTTTTSTYAKMDAPLDMTTPKRRTGFCGEIKDPIEIRPRELKLASKIYNSPTSRHCIDQSARPMQNPKAVFTSGQIQELPKAAHLDATNNNLINNRISGGKPKCCLGSTAVGIRFGVLLAEPLTLRDPTNRELVTAMKTGKISVGLIYDICGRLIVRKRGVTVIPPDRRGWRCSWCFEEDEDRYNGWDGWAAHVIHQVGVLSRFIPMICPDCGRDPLITFNLDDCVEAVVAWKRNQTNISAGRIAEVTPIRGDCICNYLSAEELQALDRIERERVEANRLFK
ncbi:hypothetical protein QAD02_014125 [Eretmocerus hayati]|uniref:Uncharacterized protein n=1 Tax=Eretmocerus hayati TaxID=131215 RepID=A0ACC2P4E7_9HYME|nr:hypothetical protein QAD02_014125 [Eretmocerus hayati]